jgi:large subunit ribosomal protein L40e
MKIFVRMLDGLLLTLDVEASDTIEGVKVKIQDQTGIPWGQLVLNFAGKGLYNEDVLHRVGIQKEATLHNFRGGSVHESSGRDGEGRIVCSGRYLSELAPDDYQVCGGSAHAPGLVGCSRSAYTLFAAQGRVEKVALMASRMGELAGHTGGSSGGGAAIKVSADAVAASQEEVLTRLVALGFPREGTLHNTLAMLEDSTGVLDDRTLDFLLQQMEAPPSKSSCCVQ